jgi:hypothetical protein
MDQLRELAWQYAADAAHVEDLPMCAAEALARGIDSPALRELAGLGRRSDPHEIRDLYAEAMAELRIKMPSAEEAFQREVLRVARDLVEGQLTPRQAASACPYRAHMSWGKGAVGDFEAQCSYFDDMIDEVYVPEPTLEAMLLDSARELIAACPSS